MPTPQDTSGFYKANEEKNALYYGQNGVYNSSYSLVRESKETYSYPVDGWTWYDSKEQALTAEGVVEVERQSAQSPSKPRRRNTTDA